MKSNHLETRLDKLYNKKNSFSLESLINKIRGMTEEQREARIAELKKKGGLENLSEEQLKKKLAELHNSIDY